MAPFEPHPTSTEHDVSGDSDVQEFLHRFAWAMTSGDGRSAAALWALPALMLGDTMVQSIMDRDELERMFRNARDHYNAAGIHDTRGEIRKIDWMSPRVVLVQVRWPHLDASGAEHGEEHASYLLRRDDHGDLKLHVAIIHGER